MLGHLCLGAERGPLTILNSQRIGRQALPMGYQIIGIIGPMAPGLHGSKGSPVKLEQGPPLERTVPVAYFLRINK